MHRFPHLVAAKTGGSRHRLSTANQHQQGRRRFIDSQRMLHGDGNISQTKDENQSSQHSTTPLSRISDQSGSLPQLAYNRKPMPTRGTRRLRHNRRFTNGSIYDSRSPFAKFSFTRKVVAAIEHLRQNQLPRVRERRYEINETMFALVQRSRYLILGDGLTGISSPTHRCAMPTTR